MSSFLDMLLGPESQASRKQQEPMAVGLTIAGSDSGGGAGIQADLKTFGACGVHGTCVLTLITAQNTLGVTDLRMLDEALVRSQFEAVTSDFALGALKTGALGSADMISLVAELLGSLGGDVLGRIVVDPVMVSKHGHSLLAEKAHRVLREALLPLALVVTPNRHECQALTGREVHSLGSMKEAAKRLFDFGPRNVLVKGAHLENIVRDVLYDGTGFVEFGADRVDSERVHGSGCVFSAAITAHLARGEELMESIAKSRAFITQAIAQARPVGRGISPVHPLHALKD